MNNKREFSTLLLFTLIGVLLPVGAKYIPVLGMLSMFFSIPYVLIGARFLKNRSLTLSLLIGSFLIIIGLTGLNFGLEVGFTYILPGFVLGILIGWVNHKDRQRKAIPFLYGLFIFLAGISIFYMIEKFAYGRDSLGEIQKLLVDILMNPETGIGNEGFGELSSSEIIDLYLELMPAIIILRAAFLSLFSYYMGNRLICKYYPVGYQKIDFKKFSLPDKAILYCIGFYVMVMFVGYFYKGLMSDSILKNLQVVFIGLFAIEGFSLFLFLVDRWKNVAWFAKAGVVFAVLLFTGFFALSILGVVDNIINFRKLDSTS